MGMAFVMVMRLRIRGRAMSGRAAAALRCLGFRLMRGFHRIFLQGRLVTYTLYGYIERMRNDIKASSAKRLAKIEGQVRGLARMVEEDRYCIDIVTQIAAVRAALRRLEEEILRDHVGHCVEHAIASGNKAEQRRKVEELMAVVSRAER
jgi:DNA-binding FrmR family transcriptional regulator